MWDFVCHKLIELRVSPDPLSGETVSSANTSPPSLRPPSTRLFLFLQKQVAIGNQKEDEFVASALHTFRRKCKKVRHGLQIMEAVARGPPHIPVGGPAARDRSPNPPRNGLEKGTKGGFGKGAKDGCGQDAKDRPGSRGTGKTNFQDARPRYNHEDSSSRGEPPSCEGGSGKRGNQAWGPPPSSSVFVGISGEKIVSNSERWVVSFLKAVNFSKVAATTSSFLGTRIGD